MRFNANQGGFTRYATVYLNGEKEPNTVEVYIPGDTLEGEGCVFRLVTINGKAVPARGALEEGQYNSDGALVEKVSGHVRIKFDECKSEFEANDKARAA